MPSVVFDPTSFVQRFPAFAWLNYPVLNDYFTEATMLIANDDTSLIQDLAQRKVILNLLVAHLAALNSGENGQAPSGLIGRVSSASEGSISVSTDYTSNSELAQWFNQTRYGAELWILLARYRQFRYVAPIRRTGRFRGGWQ